MKIRIATTLPLKMVFSEITKNHLQSHVKLVDAKTRTTKADVFFGAYREYQREDDEFNWIQLDSVDIGGIKFSKDSVVTTIRGVFSEVIAQTILGSLLNVYRGLYTAFDAQNRKIWKRWEIRKQIESLVEKKVVILGAGSIAQSVINVLRPYRVSLMVYRKRNKALKNTCVITSRFQLQRNLKCADIVINTLPTARDTENFLSADLLNTLKSTAILVNVGRGTTLDEQKAVKLLQQGRIKSLILDVTQEEPVKKSSNLWKTPGLFLTQHTAGGHEQELEMKCKFFIENLKRYITKKPLKNKVTL